MRPHKGIRNQALCILRGETTPTRDRALTHTYTEGETDTHTHPNTYIHKM